MESKEVVPQTDDIVTMVRGELFGGRALNIPRDREMLKEVARAEVELFNQRLFKRFLMVASLFGMALLYLVPTLVETTKPLSKLLYVVGVMVFLVSWVQYSFTENKSLAAVIDNLLTHEEQEKYASNSLLLYMFEACVIFVVSVLVYKNLP